MPQVTGTSPSTNNAFVREMIEQYRKKLLDLTSRNPLINFRHSERSRSHIRVIEEIPESLFNKIAAGKQLFFEPLPDPEFVPGDENTPMFINLLRKAKNDDNAYAQAIADLGPNASIRQKQRIERDLRNRLRLSLGLSAFQPTWEVAKRAAELGLATEYDLPGFNFQPTRRHQDSKIRTLFFAEDLERKLGGLRDAARVLEKDAGFNALFCTFAYLEYYETDHSDEKRVAPLVFVPVDLDRILVQQRYSYFLHTRNEEVQTNVVLAELLKQMGINLPPWEEDDKDENSLAVYLKRVEEAIAQKRDWKLRRYVTIGLFTFSTLAMYKDLDPRRWPADAPLEQRPVVNTLIAGTEISQIQYADDYEIDTLQGPEPLLITDADSSQHSAVVDVLRSKTSQVIQGPPGTGKSQTITNIIAAALNEGLSVLFVAEKMAALEVVKKRLDSAGLEAFCLELHSNKTSKVAVTASLSKRIDYRPPRIRTELAQSNADALRAAKSELLYYVQHVNQDAGKTGVKIYDVLLGSAIREVYRNDLPAAIVDVRLHKALELSTHSFRQMLDAAATLEEQTQGLTMFGKLAAHPWRGVQNIEITELDESRLVTLMTAWAAAIQRVLDLRATINQLTGLSLPDTTTALADLCHELSKTPLPPSLTISGLYAEYATESNRIRARDALKEFKTLLGLEAQLATLTDHLDRVLDVGSSKCQKALRTVRHYGVKEFTISSLEKNKYEHQQRTATVNHLESFCTLLVEAVGNHRPTITSVRSAAAAIELILRLPRALWQKRSQTVLDETNRSVLERACTQISALNRKRIELESEVDLELLPHYSELREYGIALKSAHFLSYWTSRKCRQARRVFRGAMRGASTPARHAVGEVLLRGAQYMSDLETLTSNSHLNTICGVDRIGVDTPFTEFLEVSKWGTDVRQRLAPLGDSGLAVRDFLFTATLDQLDRLVAFGARQDFNSLADLLSSLPEDSEMLWADLAQQESITSTALALAVDTFEHAGFRYSCNQNEIALACDLLQSAEKARANIENDGSTLKVVGGSLEALRNEVDSVTATLNFATSVDSLDLPQEFVDYFFNDPLHISKIQKVATNVLEGISAMKLRAGEANDVAQIDPKLWCGSSSLLEATLPNLLARNMVALEHISTLRDYVNFLLAEDAATDQGIGPVLSAYSSGGEDYTNLTRAVEFVFFRSAAESLLNGDPRLRRHSGATHQELRKQFQDLDREYLDIRRKQLAIKVSERFCPAGNSFGPVAELTELALVTRLAGQTRPRVSVRDLIKRAGQAILSLKPCWMMSPMSVAQYLEPGKLNFDLVLMDEASQIRPEEALGGIARGKKAVIVGDQMQLPPTPFFQKLSTGSLEDEDTSEETKQDSVLEAATGRFYPSRRLKWHYRSEHGSLIAFSNHEFYDDQLTVFPSPFYDHPEYGVSLVQTGGIYESGLNEIEGKAVVKAATDFMKNSPGQSLGIVAVNAKQAEFIREHLDRACATDENAAAYAQRWESTLESMFVKNLENVQGDERDAIFISTVYGKDRVGNFHQRFGPINGIYGHRRLNVLFTRAKKRVSVFTSMIPEEIQDEDKQWGVKVLKGYLQFARDGLAVIPKFGGECDSEFEQWVLEVLQANGYQGVPQVGVCGYRIDIAVRHPLKNGVFLCGIECDGATYHSARSVRERDRLRQEILERYGWKLYRIWSTDWFRNPTLQTKHMLNYLRQLHPPTT